MWNDVGSVSTSDFLRRGANDHDNLCATLGGVLALSIMKTLFLVHSFQELRVHKTLVDF